MVRVHFIGTGDTVGSGGRFQTCISLRHDQTHILIDCGASSLIAMKQQGIDSSTIDAIFVTHLHGDHFAGIPYFLLDAQFGRRVRPITLVGPPGVSERLARTMEALFPGMSQARRSFAVDIHELPERVRTPFGACAVKAFTVDHASGAPAYALRVELDSVVVAYSGDTAWTDVLLEAANTADLFICESYFFEKRVPFHLDYATLCHHRARLSCRRVILTHANVDLLKHRHEIDVAVAELAHDGMVVELERRDGAGMR